MAWTVEELSESKPLPLLKLEKDKPVRIRILAPQSAPVIPSDSLYANGTWDKAKHFPPDDVKAVIGARPVDCIGIRNACIFHEGLLAWDTTYDNLINVVVYEGVNAREKTYTESFILGLNMKLSLWKNMGEQLALLGLEKNQLWAVDWMIIKTGEGQYNTKYNCTAITDTLDAEVPLLEFPAQEEYGDTDLPMLIDFRKFYPNPLTTPQQQEEWYNAAQTKAALKSASEHAGSMQANVGQPHVSATVMQQSLGVKTAPALQAAPQLPGLKNITPTASANAPIQITMQSGEKKRGRPAGSSKNTQIPVGQLNPAITQAPTAMPGGLTPMKMPPSIGKVAPAVPQVDPRAAYDAAGVMVDPWGVDLLHSEYLQFIVDATPEQMGEYSLTPELVAAAKLVQAGPPVEVAAAKPVLPGMPKLPGQAPVVTPAPVAQTEVNEVGTLQADLTKILMNLPVFKNPMNIASFFKLFYTEGNVRTVRQVTDAQALKTIIDFANQGNDVIAQSLGLSG